MGWDKAPSKQEMRIGLDKILENSDFTEVLAVRNEICLCSSQGSRYEDLAIIQKSENVLDMKVLQRLASPVPDLTAPAVNESVALVTAGTRTQS